MEDLMATMADLESAVMELHLQELTDSNTNTHSGAPLHFLHVSQNCTLLFRFIVTVFPNAAGGSFSPQSSE